LIVTYFYNWLVVKWLGLEASSFTINNLLTIHISFAYIVSVLVIFGMFSHQFFLAFLFFHFFPLSIIFCFSLVPFMLICFIFLFHLHLITTFCFFLSLSCSLQPSSSSSYCCFFALLSWLQKTLWSILFFLLFILKPLSFSSHLFWCYSHGCKKSGMFINHNPFFKKKNLLVGLSHSLIVMVYC